MVIQRRTLSLASLAVLLSASALFAQAAAQQPRKLSNDEKKELTAVNQLLTGLSSGQPAPNALGLAWIDRDLLKAQGNKQYVPFTVTIDPSKVSGGRVALYWRLVSRDQAPPDPKAKKDDKKAPQYAFENIHMVNVSGTAPVRISRSFVADAGSYDLFVVAKEPGPGRKDQPARVAVLQQPVTVENLWSSELTTSSVIVAERIDPLPAPLSPSQQEERPYALGNMEIVKAPSTALKKSNELSVFLLIYNARTDAANAPDVTVEYNFYTTQSGTEKFFNKTNPQSMNAQTLPSGFDPAAGITNGQTIPLASFPEGDYRLEIKITDKLASKSLTRDVKFSVGS
jgi:hypothetical protein